MKPKWYFTLGLSLLFLGVVGVSMGVIFLVNLGVFLIKRSGHFAPWRLQAILASFPWWLPVTALLGIVISLLLLRKYDFSYKKNFFLIAVLFIASLFAAGFLLDKLGLNERLSRGRLRRFYQQMEIRPGPGGGKKGKKATPSLSSLSLRLVLTNSNSKPGAV